MNVEISKKDFRNTLYFLLSGKKRAELESLGIKLTQKDITRASPNEYQNILKELYFKLTGRIVTVIRSQPAIKYVLHHGTKEEAKYKYIPDHEDCKKRIPPNCTITEEFDVVIIYSTDSNGVQTKDTLKNKFNFGKYTNNSKR